MTEFKRHGANPKNVYELFGIEEPKTIYDFSTNVNVIKGKKFTFSGKLEEYPDEDCSALRRAISKKEKINEDKILITNGTSEAIQLIAILTGDKKSAVLEPVYGQYLSMLKAFNRNYRLIGSISEIKQTDKFIWLCNPNNPTGSFIPYAELNNITLHNSDKIFVIDEAYRDFLRHDKKGKLQHRENVIILRSLTKFYRLAFVRIGYLIASANIVKQLKTIQPDWSVNGVAQQYAIQALGQKGLEEKTRLYYEKETPRFIGALRSVGVEVIDSETNFFLVKTSDDEKVIKFLLTKGIVVRHTRNFPGLDGKYIRIAVRTKKENDMLVKAMKEYLK